MPAASRVNWQENGVPHSAAWWSGAGVPAPSRVQVLDDSASAETAWRLACEGTALLWRGDFHNARQLLQALSRRADRARVRPAERFPEDFHRYRMAQAQRARTLGRLLLPLEAGYVVPLRRAPDVRQACAEAMGEVELPCVVSLRELQGMIGAHEWRRRGVPIAALGASIHPHYGVFSPVRGEYVDLLAAAPLPAALAETGAFAIDVGTGTGVLAAVLANRGVAQVIATDMDARALACAGENIERLGFGERVRVERADLFPNAASRAALIVCNPPWLPGKPASPLEHAIYDPESRMLRAFIDGLGAHLAPAGEGWLILSDLAEHLGLRRREDLLDAFSAAGLRVLMRHDTRPRHPRAADRNDPLHAARSKEVTSLWRLGYRGQGTEDGGLKAED